MPPTHPSQADVAAAYRTLIAHETEPKEQDFYRTRLQRLEQATESVCEFDCRNRVAAAGVGVYCPQVSAKCADTDLATQLAKAIRAAWVDRLDWDELAQGALEFLSSTNRLVPAGGMALTAEEGYLAGKVMAALCTRNGYFGEPLGLVDALKFLESALFPATEPAEERCRKWTVRVAGGIETGIQCVLPDGHECFHDYVPPIHNYVQPAPAEPAEEETKAVTFDEIAQSLKRIGDAESSFGFNLRFWRRIAEKLIAKYPHLASSPVVPAPTEPEEEVSARCREHDPHGRQCMDYAGHAHPHRLVLPTGDTHHWDTPAPTETGPWQTWRAVPDGRTVRAANGEMFRKTGVDAIHLLTNGVGDCCKILTVADLLPTPFVAAEER